MIVDSVTASKAKFLLEGIEGDGITVTWAKVSEFCGKDETYCLAVWKKLPVGSKIRDYLYNRIKIQAENAQPESLLSTTVLYLMSSSEKQKELKPQLQKLIKDKGPAWELIRDEPGLENVI